MLLPLMPVPHQWRLVFQDSGGRGGGSTSVPVSRGAVHSTPYNHVPALDSKMHTPGYLS